MFRYLIFQYNLLDRYPLVAVMPKSIYRPEYVVLRELIREVRTARGITQNALSERLGHNQSFLSDIERGTRRIDVLELRDLCQEVDTDLLRFVAELEQRIAQSQEAAPQRATRRKSAKSRAKS
jgi:transcriptional regulator with XRE-family HTH domain